MRNVSLLDKVTKGRELPDGYDQWAIRAVRPDLMSSHGYRWPFPGNVAETPGPIINHTRACPLKKGDGICVATTWDGMAGSSVPARALLLVAYADADVLGGSRDGGELRVKRALVVDVIDGERLVREHGNGANLTRANLGGAHLTRAHLDEADLSGADLGKADLREANLTGANLGGANLRGANLRGAHLTGAHLDEADLSGADLGKADLRGADLRGADLSGANLGGADLGGADIRGADLGLLWERGPDGYAQKIKATP